jgi:hypothetical protein
LIAMHDEFGQKTSFYERAKGLQGLHGMNEQTEAQPSR